MAKRKFQTGDKVRVKDLNVGDIKFGFVFTKKMSEVKGQTLTIEDWHWDWMAYTFKEIKLDIPAYFLEKVDSTPAQLAPKFKVGDKVKLKSDEVTRVRYGQDFDEMKSHIWKVTRIMPDNLYVLHAIDTCSYGIFGDDRVLELYKEGASFKVGDKVKFKQDLVVGKTYDNIIYYASMDMTKDNVWNINSMNNIIGNYSISCYSNPDRCMNWIVSKEMIEPYVEEQPKCCEDKTVNCTEPTPMKKELELPKEAFEVTGPKEPSSLIARRKNRKIYYTADKPIC